ncbi:10 TM acyl transferase domain found in Cas1p-domain-containing protein [Circinella umbellata]|nr:10 TM acyl transferase domain found in Cas1p-domain-containing protein [Circinella umbellata]
MPSNQNALIQIGVCLTFVLVFIAGIVRFIFDPNDQSRCNSLLNNGWWQDTETYTKWQPGGCMMHTYKPDEISSCLQHARILYVGDSIAREQFFSFARLIRDDIETAGPKHVDRKYEFNDQGLIFEFWWDPYLNASRTSAMLKTTDPTIQPSLLVMGSGAWYMRYLDEDTYREDWQDAMDRIFDAVQRSSRVADAVILAPVEIPDYSLLSPEREETMSINKIDSMNAYLESKLASSTPLTPMTIPFVWNDVSSTATNVTEDGLHFKQPVTAMQVQLALNYRCNDQLSKHFPMDSTCCYHYPIPKWYQCIFFIFFLIWAPIGLYISTNESILNAVFIFGLGVIYMYFGDRTQLFGKAQKDFDAIVFGALLFISLVAGILTLKVKKEGDQGFLNRDQTDEWKGWMQVIILIYHFMGASSVSGIYNPVRILVAAYLFQTGYGHFFFFYKKGDFGIGRVLSVMIRLNLLTFVLQYVMDTDYLSYYFTPLVSFWFGVIWVTMYIGHSSNKTSWFLLCKLLVAFTMTTIIIQSPGVLEDIFDLLKFLFNIHWNATEWRFRLGLDAYIIYIGMLCAYATIKFNEYRLQEHPWWPTAKKFSIITSGILLTGYFIFELSMPTKYVYNGVHPYISWVPIIAFIVLRNATVQLRNTSSRFFIFFGRISLETFIGQFHMWLAGDTKGLLVVISHARATQGFGWWFNLVVSSILFVFVSYYLSQTTGELTRWLCSAITSGESRRATDNTSGTYHAVPLLPTSSANRQEPASSSSAASEPDNSSSNGSNGNKNVGRHETDGDNNNNMDIEMVESMQTSPKRSCVSNFFDDARVRTGLALLIIGLLNNFC